jgi:hypothetical protein
MNRIIVPHYKYITFFIAFIPFQVESSLLTHTPPPSLSLSLTFLPIQQKQL